MKKKCFCLLVTMLLLAALPAAALADMGPKPSVRIRFSGLGDAECWATLLSTKKQWGPYAAPDVSRNTWRSEGSEEIWQKFADYEAPEGFYFLQYYKEVTGDGSLSWTYYPPEIFRVLLYFPETDRFVLSDVYKSYAFDSYYTFTLTERTLTTDLPPFSGVKDGSEELATREPDPAPPTEAAEETPVLTGRRSYDYGAELRGFALRALGTLAMEALLALAFGYRNKKAFGLILAVNLLTQTALNAGLGAIRFRYGPATLHFWYAALELAVCLAEAAVYARLLPRYASGTTKKRAVVYAAAANGLSFAAGLGLSALFPALF